MLSLIFTQTAHPFLKNNHTDDQNKGNEKMTGDPSVQRCPAN